MLVHSLTVAKKLVLFVNRHVHCFIFVLNLNACYSGISFERYVFGRISEEGQKEEEGFTDTVFPQKEKRKEKATTATSYGTCVKVN